jgi:DNA polymerase elongation subunit (family B)
MFEKKDTYTNEQLAKKIIANSFLQPLGNPSNFFYCPEIAEKITKTGCEKVREMQKECEKALDRYDELSKHCANPAKK